MTNAIAVFVNDAIKHLQSQSYADSGRGQSFSRWFRSTENAVEILREAKSRVKQTKTPIEKATTVIDLVNSVIKAEKYASIEYVLRVWKLMEPPRSMTLKAASTVVQAAMFGDGCIEGTVRKRIEEEQRGTDTRTGNLSTTSLTEAISLAIEGSN